MAKYDAILKGGDAAKMGPAAIELTKITAKLGPLQKKATDTKKKMDDALKAFSKVAPSK